MELRILRYFLEVANEGNISRAANHLHISQPTLSKQIQDLEDRIGKKLFIRGNRGIKLTEEGQFLKKRAEEILELVRNTENELKSEDISGNLYIGAVESQYVSLFTKIFTELYNENSDIKLNICSGNNDYILDKLRKGLIDFGLIINTDIENFQEFELLEIPQKEFWGILVNRKHPLAQKEIIDPEDLKSHNLIISQELEKSNRLEKLLGYSSNEINIVGTYTLLYNASIMVENGIGLALAWDKIINTQDSELKYIPLKTDKVEKLAVIYKKNSKLTKLAERFLKELVQ